MSALVLSVSALAAALGGQRHGSYWSARCPAHEDKHPSLSISEGADGIVLLKCHAGCSQDMVLDALRGRGLWLGHGERHADKPLPARPKTPKLESDTAAAAARIWRESLDSKGTWVEAYLSERGLRLPENPEVRCRTLRYHPSCFDGGPALVLAFTPIEQDVPDDPFLDPPPVAIHRIRGRGHDNKKMLGPVKGCAVMISPRWHVWETLHVCEGVETALALWNDGADDPEKCRCPIWALGSAGAIADLPVILHVRHLVIWADNDKSGCGLDAAKRAAIRWCQTGRRVVIRNPNKEGSDYGDV